MMKLLTILSEIKVGGNLKQIIKNKIKEILSLSEDELVYEMPSDCLLYQEMVKMKMHTLEDFLDQIDKLYFTKDELEEIYNDLNKLRKVNEIKIRGKITSQEVHDLWLKKIIDSNNNEEAIRDRMNIRRKYSPNTTFTKTLLNNLLSQSQLNSLYQDILDYLKKYNIE